ncbi:MAG TPA: hypothetical protein DDY78_05750 [Planctomycetales bacterium]|jgi:hypothetical protein|nr:hypothetical protein [Planctomycetales bacterium]
MPRFFTVCLIAATALACASCGPAAKKVFPVHGKVFFDGQPAKGAYVIFYPPADNKDFTKGDQPRAQVGDDGSFQISTYKTNDGAPAGKYAVTIYWEKKSESGDDGAVAPLGKYAAAATTSLQAEVKEGPTELPPFQLTREAAASLTTRAQER